jgi:Fe-S-cluster containining protein
MSPGENRANMPLPGLRPGVVLVGEGEEAEVRDMQLGQVVRLGEVASSIVALLDGTRDAEGLLKDAARILREELNPLGLVELLEALDRRALLDTPRARMIVAHGRFRADIGALQRLGRRTKLIREWRTGPAAQTIVPGTDTVEVAPGARFSCHSCTRCCSEQHLLGPVTRAERDAILSGFAQKGDEAGSDPSNFIPLPTGGSQPVYLLRPRDGHCSFLRADGMCRIHADLGVEIKPAVCRMFPYRGVKTPDGWHVGLSLSCPSVASGRGPDPKEDAARAVRKLQVLAPSLLRQVPEYVPLAAGVLVPWETYRSWERRTLERLDEATDAAEAWLEGLRDFRAVVDTARATSDDTDPLGGDGIELEEASEEKTHESGVLPERGVGELEPDAERAADSLLRDLALWTELLVGLEAADPLALRRLRSALLRLRAELGVEPLAAPVMAEIARLEARARDARIDTNPHRAPLGGDVSTLRKEETGGGPTDPDIAVTEESPPSDPDVQRRFLCESLMDKRVFEYSTVGRGLLGLTLMLSVLRLREPPGDELHPRVSDVAYLVHHPQLIDIVDTRASVRAMESEPLLHERLLGMAAETPAAGQEPEEEEESRVAGAGPA